MRVSIVSSRKKRHNKKRLDPSDEKGDFFCSPTLTILLLLYSSPSGTHGAPPLIHLSRYFTNLAFFFFFDQGCHIQQLQKRPRQDKKEKSYKFLWIFVLQHQKTDSFDWSQLTPFHEYYVKYLCDGAIIVRSKIRTRTIYSYR